MKLDKMSNKFQSDSHQRISYLNDCDKRYHQSLGFWVLILMGYSFLAPYSYSHEDYFVTILGAAAVVYSIGALFSLMNKIMEADRTRLDIKTLIDSEAPD